MYIFNFKILFFKIMIGAISKNVLLFYKKFIILVFICLRIFSINITHSFMFSKKIIYILYSALYIIFLQFENYKK